MSTIYYCDAPSCGKKEPGRPSKTGWVPPDGWSNFNIENDSFDACSKEHADKIVEANTVEPEPIEEEEAEAEE